MKSSRATSRFRMIEFEQMEMQYFVKPGVQLEAFEMWQERRMKWYAERLGLKPENLSWYKHDKLAHYADAAYDIKYKFPFGTEEIEGIHSRTDYDLRRHQEYSGKNMEYVEPDGKNALHSFRRRNIGRVRPCLSGSALRCL